MHWSDIIIDQPNPSFHIAFRCKTVGCRFTGCRFTSFSVPDHLMYNKHGICPYVFTSFLLESSGDFFIVWEEDDDDAQGTSCNKLCSATDMSTWHQRQPAIHCHYRTNTIVSPCCGHVAITWCHLPTCHLGHTLRSELKKYNFFLLNTVLLVYFLV